jgi:hypothetical protein
VLAHLAELNSHYDVEERVHVPIRRTSKAASSIFCGATQIVSPGDDMCVMNVYEKEDEGMQLKGIRMLVMSAVLMFMDFFLRDLTHRNQNGNSRAGPEGSNREDPCNPT